MCFRESTYAYADAVLALGARTHMRKDICMQASTVGAPKHAFVCASVCAPCMQKGFLPAPTHVAPHAHARARASARSCADQYAYAYPHVRVRMLMLMRCECICVFDAYAYLMRMRMRMLMRLRIWIPIVCLHLHARVGLRLRLRIRLRIRFRSRMRAHMCAHVRTYTLACMHVRLRARVMHMPARVREHACARLCMRM